MSKLNIKLRVSPITQLAQDSNGKYNFVVDINKVDGSPINSDKVPNSTLISADAFIEDSVSKILLPIDIADGDYSMNVSFDVFSQDRGVLLANIDNYFLQAGDSDSDLAPVVGVKNGIRTYNVGEWWFDLVGSKYAWFEVLSTGFVRLQMPTEQDSFNGRNKVSPIVVGDLWEDILEDTPDQINALRSKDGIDLPPFESLTAIGYPARADWGKTFQEIKESDPSGIRIWYSFGNNDTNAPEDTFYRNNSGEPHQASIYKYKPTR